MIQRKAEFRFVFFEINENVRIQPLIERLASVLEFGSDCILVNYCLQEILFINFTFCNIRIFPTSIFLIIFVVIQ